MVGGEPIARTETYAEHQCYWINCIYYIAILIWLIIIIYFRLHTMKGTVVLWLPFLVFIIGLRSVEQLNGEVEQEMFKASYLSVGLILALPLLVWMNKDYAGDLNQYVSIIVLAMTLTLLTLVDIWVPIHWVAVCKHIRTCLQTMSITLFIFAMINYSLNRYGTSLP